MQSEVLDPDSRAAVSRVHVDGVAMLNNLWPGNQAPYWRFTTSRMHAVTHW